MAMLSSLPVALHNQGEGCGNDCLVAPPPYSWSLCGTLATCWRSATPLVAGASQERQSSCLRRLDTPVAYNVISIIQRCERAEIVHMLASRHVGNDLYVCAKSLQRRHCSLLVPSCSDAVLHRVQ